jgi:hypothetical protein
VRRGLGGFALPRGYMFSGQREKKGVPSTGHCNTILVNEEEEVSNATACTPSVKLGRTHGAVASLAARSVP